MHTDTYRNLPIGTRLALNAVYYAESIRWSAPIGYILILMGLVLAGLWVHLALSADSHYRPVGFASEEIHLWEAYATVHRPDLLPLLAKDENLSRSKGLPQAWVSKSFLQNLSAPIVASSPLSTDAAARLAAKAPKTFALAQEREALRSKIHASLTSWTTCPAPASILGPKTLDATSTPLEISCGAIESYHWWPIALFIAGLLAVALFLVRLILVVVCDCDSFIPESLVFGLTQPLYYWLDDRGDQVFSRLEAASISLSSLRRPLRRSPPSKSSRL